MSTGEQDAFLPDASKRVFRELAEIKQPCLHRDRFTEWPHKRFPGYVISAGALKVDDYHRTDAGQPLLAQVLAGVSQAGGDAVDGQEDGVGEVGSFAFLAGGVLLSSFVEDERAADGA